jgi:hypothetical protein
MPNLSNKILDTYIRYFQDTCITAYKKTQQNTFYFPANLLQQVIGWRQILYNKTTCIFHLSFRSRKIYRSNSFKQYNGCKSSVCINI